MPIAGDAGRPPLVPNRSGVIAAPLARRSYREQRQAARKPGLDYRGKPQQIFIDSTGMGGPIYNRLQHQNVPVIGISFGGKSEGYTKVDCANRKAELYTVFREHLGLLALPLDKELRQQMINVEGELNRQGKVQIESKQDLRRRGLPSPDFLESLILTVAQGINNEGVRSDWGRGDHLVRSEYDPFARESVDGPPRMPPRVYAPGWARLREDD